MTKQKVLCALHRDYPLAAPLPCTECGANTSLGCQLCMACAALHQECQVCRAELPALSCETLRAIAQLGVEYEDAAQSYRDRFARAVSAFEPAARRLDEAHAELNAAGSNKIWRTVITQAEQDAIVNKMLEFGADPRAVTIARLHRDQMVSAAIGRGKVEMDGKRDALRDVELALIHFRDRYDAASRSRDGGIRAALTARDERIAALIGCFYVGAAA